MGQIGPLQVKGEGMGLIGPLQVKGEGMGHMFESNPCLIPKPM